MVDFYPIGEYVMRPVFPMEAPLNVFEAWVAWEAAEDPRDRMIGAWSPDAYTSDLLRGKSGLEGGPW